MPRPKRFLVLLSFIFFSTGLGAQSVSQNRVSISRETLPNLGALKTRLIAYHDCVHPRQCYSTDLNHQSDLAITYLQRRVEKAKPQEKLALVLDIDETALSNWDEVKQDDFGYIAKDWNDWIDKKQAPAIAATLRLYNEALKLHVSVFFITGRSTAQEVVTSDNLKSAGYSGWAGLALRGPHPPTQTVSEFKSGERQKIVDAGYHIILNVGDQLSDLTGSPQADRSIKLPNPFYFIP
jgi:acid phosphatase